MRQIIGNKVRLTVGPEETPVCDFCSSEKIVKDYDCPDFLIPVVNAMGQRGELGSQGKWAACQICADLIDAGQQDQLMARALQTCYAQHPSWPKDGPIAEGLVKFIHDLHMGFWKGWAARTGA